MTDDDPVARFRRQLSETETEEAAASERENARVYKAFEAQDKVLRLDIRRLSGASHSPAYAYLLDIIYGSRFYTSFVLVFTFMAVTVKGRNLRDVVQAIRLGKAGALTEFHPGLFDWPPEGVPIIERIEVVVGPDRAAALAEMDER